MLNFFNKKPTLKKFFLTKTCRAYIFKTHFRAFSKSTKFEQKMKIHFYFQIFKFSKWFWKWFKQCYETDWKIGDTVSNDLTVGDNVFFMRSPWPQSMSSKRIHLRAWPVRPQGKCENDSVQNFLQIWRWLGSGGWRSSWKFIKIALEFHVRVFNIKWHWMGSGGKHIRKHIHVRRIVKRSCRPRST